MTVTDQECIDYARECIRLAQSAANNPELRESLMRMAREWMAAAMHEEPEPIDGKQELPFLFGQDQNDG